MNLLLIGPRGAGKTSVGRLVARSFDLPFVDLDDLVLGQFPEHSVQEVWASNGEEAWRQQEYRILKEVLQRDDQIIALGGGTPTIPDAWNLITNAQHAGHALVMYLQSSAEVLRARLQNDSGDRPTLTGEDPIEEIETILKKRESSVYLPMADTVIQVDQMSAKQCAHQVAAAFLGENET